MHIVEALLSSLFSWMKGDSLNHCMLQNLFIHTCVMEDLKERVMNVSSDSVSDEDCRMCVLFSFVSTVLSLLISMQSLMTCCNVCEVDEFDWNNGFTLDYRVDKDKMKEVTQIANLYLHKESEHHRLLLQQLVYLERLKLVFDACSVGKTEKVQSIKQALADFIAALTSLVSIPSYYYS